MSSYFNDLLKESVLVFRVCIGQFKSEDQIFRFAIGWLENSNQLQPMRLNWSTFVASYTQYKALWHRFQTKIKLQFVEK